MLLLFVLLLVGLLLQPPSRAEENLYHPTVRVYFSPDGGCTDAVVRELAAARQQVLLQAYSFTSAPIATALLDAQKRGVEVRAILDKSTVTAQYSSATFLANASIPVAIDSWHAIAHNKIMIIDDAIVVTGSFNFTKAAEHANAENLLILRDAALTERYHQNWLAHAAHAQDYQVTASSVWNSPAAGSVSPSSESRAANTAQNNDTTVHGNRNSKVYHLPGCPGYTRMSEKNEVKFASDAEAVAAGFRRAKNCP